MEDSSDGEIIRRVLLGDVDAFEGLIERYRAFVFRVVRAHVPFEAVEEIAHEVFIDAFRGLASFSQGVPFRHWISRLAVRRAYDYWRRERRRKEFPESSLSEEAQRWCMRVAAEESEEVRRQRSADHEAREVLEYALGQLSPEDRTVLVLVHVQGYPVEEAALLLGWSRVGVKVRAFRARRRMRKILEQLGVRDENAVGREERDSGEA